MNENQDTPSLLPRAAAPLQQFRDRLRACDVYFSAILIYAASRVVVGIGVAFGTMLTPPPGAYISGPGSPWYDRLLRWDGGWYASIALNGYHYNHDPASENPVVFYPLYPLVSSLVSRLFGLDIHLALLLVANGAGLAVALLMTKFVKDELGDEVALLSLALFSFFPFSIFMSAAYTEPLCLACMLSSLILMRREQFLAAALMAALSLAARSTGIVMIPVLLWEMWSRSPARGRQLALRMALRGLVAASSLLIYMAYLGWKFGTPMAFAADQAAWQPGSFLQRFIAAVTLKPFFHFNWYYGGWFVGCLALTVASINRFRFTVTLYALGTLMLPYLTLNITPSMNRYVLTCFPAFMALGILCQRRFGLAAALIGIFAALLLRESAFFSQWYWVG